MKFKNKTNIGRIRFSAVFITGFLLINCAGTPDVNPTVQEAKNAYREIADDSLVINNAPEALREAEKAVEQLSGFGKSQEELEQQALLAKQRVKIAQKKAELKAAQDEVRRTTRELRSLLQEVRRDDLKKMNAKARAKTLSYFDVQETSRGIVLRFLDVTFNREKASLTSAAEPPINELADYLDAYPERTILIEGHTDNTGAASFNKNLSQQRANTVRDALISRGINENRIRAVGLGEEYPIADNETEAGRQQNRRVEIVISDESGAIPER